MIDMITSIAPSFQKRVGAALPNMRKRGSVASPVRVDVIVAAKPIACTPRWLEKCMTPHEIISAAEQRLEVARFGLEDMQKRDQRFNAGLMNAVVFGRMATFQLQNLRSIIPDYDDWYGPKQDEMRADPLMKYFCDLRNRIEKQKASRLTVQSGTINFKSADMEQFLPAPSGAVSFFMGDQMGRSGWDIVGPDGQTEKYYIEVPKEILDFNAHFRDAPEALERRPAEELLAEYLDKVGAVVADARSRFVR